ncbi:MAG: hypothetical protein M0P76_05410 [Candidatus Pacebacteria bacterium]|nr:hypothetical protein [Candidatus Paceibacterota bacterium]
MITASPLYFLREEIYLTWRKFTLWCFPLFLFIILFPDRDAADIEVVSAEGFLLFLCSLFVVVSFMIIAVKSWKLKGK